MFTGIVTALGRIRAISGEGVRRFEIESIYEPGGVDMGASISHDGACLTVVDKGEAGAGGDVENDVRGWHAVEISPETLRLTTLGDRRVGDMVNLERSLKIGDELGGHLVTGHVDGVGRVLERRAEGEWTIFAVEAPGELARFIAKKGSIAVNGVSLTVNEVEDNRFELMIIPHTAEVTTLGQLQAGDRVNLEIDLMARYAARLAQYEGGSEKETA